MQEVQALLEADPQPTNFTRRVFLAAWVVFLVSAAVTFANRRDALVDQLTATPSLASEAPGSAATPR